MKLATEPRPETPDRIEIEDQFCRDLNKVTDRKVLPSELFFEFTRRISRQYHISQGVLVLAQEGKQLMAVSTWKNGARRDGLAINLPSDQSLFRNVGEDGRTYVEACPECFSGNFFEKKLLMDEETRSFVLQPLRAEGELIGLLGYSSNNPSAFALMDDGRLNGVAEKLAEYLANNSKTD